MLEVDMLGLQRILKDSSLSEQTRVSRVKSYVLHQPATKTSGGATVLMKVSGETFSCARPRISEWLISAMSTSIQNGGAVTQTALRQPLGAGPVSCAAS